MKVKEKAILRYIDKKEHQHRIMCDTTASMYLCDTVNVNGVVIGEIYITDTGILFIATKDDIYLPAAYGKQIKALQGGDFNKFERGQEALKDQIAKYNPDLYMEYFKDTEGVETWQQSTKKTRN